MGQFDWARARERANQIWDKKGIEFYRDLDNKANDSENCVLFACYFVKFEMRVHLVHENALWLIEIHL